MHRTRRAGSSVALVVSALLVQAAAAGPAEPPAPSRLEKLARILELEDRRSGAGELERLLHDPDRGVRRRAALAAGRLARASSIVALVELMNDGEVEVRRVAAFALGLVGARLAVDRLRAALADSDAGVRARAAQALGRIGDARVAPDIARLVVDSLPKTIGRMTVRDDPGDPADSWLEQRLALIALAELKDVAAARYALLADGRPRFDWWTATWVAMRVESPSLLPVLRAAAASDDPRSRALAARGLGMLKDVSAVETLVSLSRDRDTDVAREALRALQAIPDRRATAAAAAALASASDVVRREALLSLAVLPPDPSLRARVVSALADPDPWLRAAAFSALARTSPDDFLLVLSGMGPDPDFRVRSALAATLGGLGDEMSIGALHAMLHDEDPRVLPAVLKALRRARGKDALDTLLRHLEHPDLGVRAAAAEELAALGGAGLVAPLQAAWRRGLGDGPGEIEARLAAVGALASQGAAALAALQQVVAEDPSRPVRMRAVAAIQALHGPSVDAGPEAVERPGLDYRRAMAPYAPRTGEALYTPRVFLRTHKGTIEIQLDVVEAPLAAQAFVALARRGFYDGLTFHRVEPGFVVQGGCPRGDGNGGPGFTLRDELTLRSFGRGAVGLALSGKDTGGSQFFITLSPQPQLDGRYPLIGQVASGLEVVDRLRPGDRLERVVVWGGE
jgi:cyclophilin family peptidyl-prolyl cis-trans isomerase/HEAT repeat protein